MTTVFDNPEFHKNCNKCGVKMWGIMVGSSQPVRDNCEECTPK